MFKFINYFMNFKNILIKFKKVNEKQFRLLGRWCHVNMPNCNYDVIIKKIDMANSDNNFCIKPIHKKKK